MEDDRFKAEMTRFMGIVIKKLDSLETEVKNNSQKIEGLEQAVKKNDRKIDTIAGQFNDVANLVMTNDKRLTKVEFDVAELKSNVH
jgi:peptidoglycan hydrolase CwlO-like protein